MSSFEIKMILASKITYEFIIDYKIYITNEPEKRSKQSCIRGLRITVYDILSYLAAGDSEDEIIKNFPQVTKDDIHAFLAYAAYAENRIIQIAS